VSHTTKLNDTIFIHDGDFGEDVRIIRPDGELRVPFEDIKGLVGHYVMMRKIAVLEQAEPDDLFGVEKE